MGVWFCSLDYIAPASPGLKVWCAKYIAEVEIIGLARKGVTINYNVRRYGGVGVEYRCDLQVVTTWGERWGCHRRRGGGRGQPGLPVPSQQPPTSIWLVLIIAVPFPLPKSPSELVSIKWNVMGVASANFFTGLNKFLAGEMLGP